jgi:hypothetical protein
LGDTRESRTVCAFQLTLFLALSPQTLPNLFGAFPPAATAHRPPPRRCVLGKALPAVGLVETPANELFEWVLHGELLPASSRCGSRRRPSPRYVRQTSLEIHLQPPFSSSWFQQQQEPAARSSELLLPPWEQFSAASPVGSDRTIRPSRQQQEQAERQRQASPARSSRSTASSRAQDFAPSSPLARWERQHRRAESTPLPASNLGGGARHDYDDGLSVSPASSISSHTLRVPRRLSRVGPGDQSFGSMTARLASSPPPPTSSRRLAYQNHHSKAPSLSNTISSTAASSLASPSHASSFRFPSSVRSRPAASPYAPTPPPQHAHELFGVKEGRSARRWSTQGDAQALEGLPPLPFDIANKSLADLVFASLRASTTATDTSQKMASSLADQPVRFRPSFTAGNDDLFSVPDVPVLARRDDEPDGLRRSRTSAGTTRRSTLPTLVGSLR